MKNHKCALLLAAMLGCLSTVSAGAVTISLVPEEVVTSKNATFAVSLVASDIGPSPIGAFDFDVLVRPSDLLVRDVMFFGSLGSPDPLDGELITGMDILTGSPTQLVDFFALSLLSEGELSLLQPDPTVLLASLRFTAPDRKVFGGEIFLNATTAVVSDAAGNVLPVTVDNRVPVTVPEPSVPALVVMMAIGASLPVARRRKRCQGKGE